MDDPREAGRAVILLAHRGFDRYILHHPILDLVLDMLL